MTRNRKTLGNLTDNAVEELRRFVKQVGRPPHIEGPDELQAALNLLCQRLRENARGVDADGKVRSVRTVGVPTKEWFPEELI